MKTPLIMERAMFVEGSSIDVQHGKKSKIDGFLQKSFFFFFLNTVNIFGPSDGPRSCILG